MKVFGIDPGSIRTGYGCIETDGRRHTLIACGAIVPAAGAALPDRLQEIHERLRGLMPWMKKRSIKGTQAAY